MARIALVDDDRNVLTQISTSLKAEGFEVETFNDSQTALHSFRKKSPDIAIVDCTMPRMNGIDLLRNVRQTNSMPVILLSEKSEEIEELLGLRMGADDFVSKSCSQRLLVERIRVVLRRMEMSIANADKEPEQQALVRGDLRIDPARYEVNWKGCDVALTATEFALLYALAQRPGIVKTREQLMDVAYDEQIFVDDRTIDSHIKRVRKKMREADASFAAIETLYGIGYRYNEQTKKPRVRLS